MHDGKSLFLGLLDHDTQNLVLLVFIFGQEDHACAIASLFRDRYSLKENEFMWDLEHDAGTIAGLVISAFRASVSHVFQNAKSTFYDVMRLFSMYVNH